MLPEVTITVEIIPYKTFAEKINIVKEELNKNRYVEIMDEQGIIYSAKKRKNMIGR